jgi:hypothetical protein
MPAIKKMDRNQHKILWHINQYRRQPLAAQWSDIAKLIAGSEFSMVNMLMLKGG